MAIFSYSRVSTSDKGQTVANQDLLIEKAGFRVDKAFEDVGVSGAIPAHDRPAFKQMISEMEEGSTCVCISIDRLGRSALDVLNTVEYFKKHKLSLRILQLDSVDLTSSVGKLLLTMLAAVAEMEKSLIGERVVAGISRTVSQGTILGTPDKLSPEAVADIKQRKLTHAQYAAKYGVSTKTIQRTMKKCVLEYSEKFEKKTVQHVMNRERRANNFKEDRVL